MEPLVLALPVLVVFLLELMEPAVHLLESMARLVSLGLVIPVLLVVFPESMALVVFAERLPS